VTAFHVLIPARLAASRFPAKLVQELAGRPVLQRVVDAAMEAGADSVHVAADAELASWCRKRGVPCVPTGRHTSGTDRVAEAARILGLGPDAVIVNVQGDAPLTPPASIASVAAELGRWPGAPMATLAVPSTEPSGDLNRVGIDWAEGLAQRFERGLATGWRHVGLYGFRGRSLEAFAAAPPSPDELAHRLEQLRAFSLGWGIRVVAGAAQGPDIDVPEDLAAAEAWLGSGA